MHGSQPGCFKLRSMLLEDLIFFLVGWWKANEVFLNRSKEDSYIIHNVAV